jgi:hypothetical protein
MKVHIPTPNTRSHTRSVLVSTPWATLWCRRPVRVTLWYMYHFILKTSTFTCSCLLTMGSHHTNRRLGTNSLVICSQNRLWCPKLLPPARPVHMGVGKRILHPSRLGAMDSGHLRSPRGPPTPPHGRFGPRQWLAHRRGHVDGPRTQLYHPQSPTLALGPRLRWVWPRASILPQNLERNLTRPSYTPGYSAAVLATRVLSVRLSTPGRHPKISGFDVAEGRFLDQNLRRITNPVSDLTGDQ